MELFKSKIGWTLSIAYILISAFLILSQGLFGESFITLILGLPWSLVLAGFGSFEGTSFALYVLALLPIILNAILLYIIGSLIEKKKTALVLGIIFCVVLGGIATWYIMFRSMDHSQYVLPISEEYPEGATLRDYQDTDLGIKFTYRTDPDGYTLTEEEKLGGESKELITRLSLMKTDQYQGYLDTVEMGVPTEGPPSISIEIYENPANLPPADWVKTTREAWYDQAVIPLSEKSLGGMPGVAYTIDGVYRTGVIVVNNDSRIYKISNDFQDPFLVHTKADAEKFLQSIVFF